MTVTLRQAHSDDAQLLAALNRFVQDDHVGALPHHFKSCDTSAVAEWFGSMLSREDVRVWLADSDGCPAGYAISIVRERPENLFCHARRYCELDQIAVSPAFRRQGVARALVQRIIADASAQGIHDVELTSWAFNTQAHAAFEALGFHPRVLRFGRDSDDTG
ncbi:MAG: hypothetical protein RJA70_2967 [Pseudomonadota bacterium]|jgi:ribosomal protein S18 acetylase RimI-like enzyme